MIALLTDFGTKDYFVAEMKAVIYSVNPKARIVDITHEIPPQDVYTGAFVLWRSYKWFPSGTIFVAVVDPGVGSARLPLLIRTRHYFFIGPDNGLLSLAAEEDAVERIYKITASLPHRSSTFHGRDVFAYAAALLSRGVAPNFLGEEIANFVRLERPSATIKDGLVYAKAIYIDRFGNIYTSITKDIIYKIAKINDELCIKFYDKEFRAKFLETYSAAPPGALVVLVNSEGFLEIAVNRGNASEELGLTAGADLVLYRC